MARRQDGSGRLYLPRASFCGPKVTFSDAEQHRLKKVLRLKSGDEITVTDGEGREYLVRLEGSGGTVVDERHPATESPLRTVLVQALPKGEKLEYLVQKAVELGVNEIRPVVSRRSVATVRGDRWRKRKMRLGRIAAAAVAQSGRTVLPVIADPETWASFAAREIKADLKLICSEGSARSLDEIVDAAASPASVVVAVGPEGGWSEEEMSPAVERGYHPFTLGPRILRTETAGFAALTLLQYRLGDMGGREQGGC